MTAGDDPRRDLLRRAFDAAVATARPEVCVPKYLPEPPKGRLIVTGAGKAAAAMARALEANWEGPLSGAVVTRHDYALPTERIEVLEAGHPVPDEASERAAQRMLDLARSSGPDDLVLFLLSGGGSALMAAPAPGLTLSDKQAVTRALLRSGATITEINCVRRHLSAIKGGRLAVAAHPAPIVTLAISDVPGDDPEAIASGPTVADPSTFADARAILAKYRIDQPGAVIRHLQAAEEETPKPGDPRLANADYRMIARPAEMLAAAETELGKAGYRTIMLGDDLEGEARTVGAEHAGLARKHAGEGSRIAILSGGELTVTIRGEGRGGPNREFALGLALALGGDPRIAAIACDTDGADGAPGSDGGDVAGAIVVPETLERAKEQGLDAAASLADNDAGGFFEAIGDAVITGATQTNVNDFRCVLID
ncbi:MAG TPA: glycerate kinase [Afifellaceae bacterium]|nr:glycerate kinase [Afifellaceae bacterium]